ncbi:alpha/beta hydrolase [Ramlibacter sp. G-1-2-2]|uniref:Alpha/beta hydrolase n=1 Tax=Ramlibacter agri TaxID=2728837 RepID=A0A848GVS8_9BURK|nr:alpha/beta hydrolase [Ramlibacter agri]NML42227.1 alpha/beta hydrolase [Ramlibacter agri]
MYRALIAAGTLALSACTALPVTADIPSGPVPSQVPPAIQAELEKLGRVVAPPPTAALYAPLQQKEPYAGVAVTRDERYGPDARHRLDVFTPAAKDGPRPVLVFVHGGAFMGGDKRTGDSPFYDNIMLWAVANGMVGVNMTYRLAPQNQWPAAQQDLAAALRWVRANIVARGGDPERIFLMGHSAGAAHVAQYVGHPEFHVARGGGIAGAIMVSGLFDPSTAEVNPPLQSYFGKDPSKYEAQSALPGMSASKLPMLFAYAELDPSDFHRQAGQVRSALCEAKRCSPLLLLLGHSHMSEIYSINTADHALTDAIRTFVSETPVR